MQMTGGVESSDGKLKFQDLKLFDIATFLSIVCMGEYGPQFNLSDAKNERYKIPPKEQYMYLKFPAFNVSSALHFSNSVSQAEV
jgi:hypothetical protein